MMSIYRKESLLLSDDILDELCKKKDVWILYFKIIKYDKTTIFYSYNLLKTIYLYQYLSILC